MAWNAPHDKPPSDEDPWTGKSPKKSSPNNPSEPPLLEDLFKKFFSYFKNFKSISKSVYLFLSVLLIFIFWLIMGIYIIYPNQEAVVFHFGRYEKNLTPGWYWLPWLADKVERYDQTKVFSQSTGSNIVSQDANLAFIKINFQYHVASAKNYVLSYKDPGQFINAIAANVLQQTASNFKLDAMLANTNSSFTKEINNNLATAFNEAGLGIALNQVNITDFSVANSIKDTFDKINALYEQQKQQRAQVASYEAEKLTAVNTEIQEKINAAQAYAEQIQTKAVQDLVDFNAILPVYKKAPALTRYRLYNETMKDILMKTKNIIVDAKAPGVMVYLNDKNDSNDIASTTENASSENSTEIENTSNDYVDHGYLESKGGYS